MSHRFNQLMLSGVAAACLFTAHTAGAAVLYDPGLGTLPAAQLWTTLGSSRGAGSQSVGGGVLDFSSTLDGYFGNGRTAPVALDTGVGFRLSWELKLKSEEHDSENRAGFSLLVQGADQTKSLELGFWTDSVWAVKYETGGADSGYLRDTAAAASIDTTAAMRTFTLTVQNNLFSLAADGRTLFNGALRDYPTKDLLTTPYSFQSYVFFGDNSSRGKSSADIGVIQLLPIPEPSAALLLTAGLVGLALARRARNRAG